MKRTDNDGYCDSGTFTSVIQDTVFQERLKLVAINELHLCAEDSWGRRQWVKYEAFPIRTSVYRSDVFLYILPTDNPTDIFKKILYTAVEESRDDLRDEIVRWLRRWNKPSSIVGSYHGALANESKDIQTICSPDEALQKLGRAARGGLMNGEKAIFFWLPESKVVGPRVCDLQPDKQLKHRVKRHKFAEKKDEEGAAPEEWRNNVLADDKEYQLYNPVKQCYWQTLLAFYGEKVSETVTAASLTMPLSLISGLVMRNILNDRIARGDLLGLALDEEIRLPIPSTNQSPGQPMASPLSASQLCSSILTSSVNTLLSFVTCTAIPVLRDNGALKDLTNKVAITPRGIPATLNKKGTGRETKHRDLKGTW
ncbi:hypothetical protein V8E54_010391 [Elaphomyces granulatus]